MARIYIERLPLCQAAYLGTAGIRLRWLGTGRWHLDPKTIKVAANS